ncbi:hypothetical protein L1887_51491 [Cichorium endivia]|nr:hypothetical protein L1887_51491 [Cichorium endivia]
MRSSFHASSIRLLPVRESLRVAVIRPAAGSRHRSDFALWSWMGCGPRRACLASLPACLPACLCQRGSDASRHTLLCLFLPLSLDLHRLVAERSDLSAIVNLSVDPSSRALSLPRRPPPAAILPHPLARWLALVSLPLSPPASFPFTTSAFPPIVSYSLSPRRLRTPRHIRSACFRHPPPARASDLQTRTASIEISRPAFSYGRPARHATLLGTAQPSSITASREYCAARPSRVTTRLHSG